MGNAVEFGGVLHHRGDPPTAADAYAAAGGRHGFLFEHLTPPALIVGRYETSTKNAATDDGLVAIVAGSIDNAAAIANAVGAPPTDDAEIVRAAYMRWGHDAFARLFGAYAAAVWDETGQRLVLARGAGVGGAPSLVFHRDGKRTIFSTRIGHLGATGIASRDMAAWLANGRWPAADRAAVADVEVVPPGQAVAITKTGRTKKLRLWTFSPLNVPRELSADAARAELDTVMTNALSKLDRRTLIVGETATTAFLSRFVPSERKRTAETFTSQDPHAILRTAVTLDVPIPLTRLMTLTKLLKEPGMDLVFDWGARESLGGTEASMRAWVRSIARAIDATPTISTAVKAVRLAWPVDRRLGTPRLPRNLANVGASVARRWARQLPGVVGQRVTSALPEPPPDTLAVEPVTGDPFVDLRFAEAMDPSLAVTYTAAVRLAGMYGRRVVAPFLSEASVELLFSIPARYFVRDKMAMWIMDGGVPVEPPVVPPPPQALQLRLDDWTEALGAPAPQDATPEVLDRWYGAAAFAEAHRLG